MKEEIYNNIEKYLTLDDKTFKEEIQKEAFSILKNQREGQVYTSGLLALTNVCKNDCSYCGLSRSNKSLKRFTLKEKEVLNTLDLVQEKGLKRIFFIGGENPTIKMDSYIKYIKEAKKRKLETNLAMGVFSKEDYKKLKDSGLDIYTIKFETSNKECFNNCKKDISFEERLKAIYNVKESGLKLGSSSIVGLKGFSLKDLVNDIKLTVDLNVDWVPIVPYLPAKNTKMALDTPEGDIKLTLRAISLLRILLPQARITAAQPKANSPYGFGDKEGNFEALKHGADTLFVEVTPFALKNQFSITDNRELPKIKEIDDLISPLNLKRC